jgi:hypothetical protein
MMNSQVNDGVWKLNENKKGLEALASNPCFASPL